LIFDESGPEPGSFFSLNISTGDFIWMNNDSISFAKPCTSPAVDTTRGLIFLCSCGRYSFSIVNAQTGQIEWTDNGMFQCLASPLLSLNNTILFLNSPSGVSALDISSFMDIIEKKDTTPPKVLWNVSDASPSAESVLSADGSMIYVTSSNIKAFETATGALVWTTTLPKCDVSSIQSPVVNPTTRSMYISVSCLNDTSYVVALDQSTGDQLFLWSPPSQEQYLSKIALGMNDLLYFGAVASYQGTLYALNATSGSVVWSNINSTGRLSPIVGGDDTVYTTTTSSLISFDGNTGTKMWESPGFPQSTSDPMIAPDGTIFIVSDFQLISFVK